MVHRNELCVLGMYIKSNKNIFFFSKFNETFLFMFSGTTLFLCAWPFYKYRKPLYLSKGSLICLIIVVFLDFDDFEFQIYSLAMDSSSLCLFVFRVQMRITSVVDVCFWRYVWFFLFVLPPWESATKQLKIKSKCLLAFGFLINPPVYYTDQRNA